MLGQTKPGMKKEHLYSVNTEKKTIRLKVG